MTRHQSAGVTSSKGRAPPVVPASMTRMPRRSIFAAARAIASASVTSTARNRTPSCGVSLALRFNTSAPAAATSRPIPRQAPVTAAVRPEKS